MNNTHTKEKRNATTKNEEEAENMRKYILQEEIKREKKCRKKKHKK